LSTVKTFNSVEVFRPNPTTGLNNRVLLLGGDGGVYRQLDDGSWTLFGQGLPNSRVSDLHYDATDDVLVVGTLGRGVWTVPNASTSLTEAATLTLTGSDGVNDAFY